MQSNTSQFKATQVKRHYLSTQMLRIVEEEWIYNIDKPTLHRPKPISKNVISETTFFLKEISLNELLAYRASRKPGFVFKYENRYFYTEIPKNIRLIAQTFKLEDISLTHLCGKNCKHASAAEDCDGGCAKIRDLPFDTLYRWGQLSMHQALIESIRIEKYDFIKLGFESFNTLHNCLFVASCKSYKAQRVYESQLVDSVANGRPPLKK